MNIKKIIILVTILFIPSISVKAYELCTPSEEYLKYQKLSEEEKAKYIEPVYCSEIMNKNNKSLNSKLRSSIFPKVYASTSDSSYNSYQNNIATSPKNQFQTGLCWDFASISTVEANARKKGLGTLDLSEAHLAYSLVADTYSNNDDKKGKYNTTVADGGKIVYAPTYYFNGYGQLNENELSFTSSLTNDTNDLKKITSSTYKKGRSIITLDNYYLDNFNSSGACTNSDISTIKANIMKNGAVLGQMYMDQDLFKDVNENYYISKESDAEFTNHAITIIGWDDTVSKSKFNNATRDGAWIIKNSWGTDWSDDGFFYISYDDEHICTLTANYEVSNSNNYEYTYKSSDLVGVPLLTLKNNMYIASKFTKQELNNKELINRISFTVGENMTYKVYISKDNTLNDKTKWIELTTGTSSLYGIKSVDLENIEIEDDFTIILEVNIPSSKISSIFTTCDYYDDNDYLTFNTNQNFISSNGTSWDDMTNINGSIKCQPNIYVYTKQSPKIDIGEPIQDGNTTSIEINTVNVNTENIDFIVKNKNGEDISQHFQIVPDYENNKLDIVSDNTVDGEFTCVINYEGIEKEINFVLQENISLKDTTNMKIENNNIYVVIPSTENFNYQSFISNLNIENTSVTTYDSSNTNVSNDNSLLGTGSKVETNNNEYNIIVVGDATGDGTIDSGDLLGVVKHLKNKSRLNEKQGLAADCNYDESIDSGDLLTIVKYLKKKGTINIKE